MEIEIGGGAVFLFEMIMLGIIFYFILRVK